MTCYVWDNDQVVTIAEFDYHSYYEAECNRHLTHRFIVDSADESVTHRYGFMKREDELAKWVFIPKEMFPKEFLTHLLLMGVT